MNPLKLKCSTKTVFPLLSYFPVSLLFFFSLIGFAQNSHAQFKPLWIAIGNGGFYLECPDSKEIYDYYETEKMGFTYSPIPGATFEEKVEFLLTKLERLDPNRAKSYRYVWNQDWYKVLLQPEIEGAVVDFEDTKDPEKMALYGLGPGVDFPEECQLKLALEQKRPRYLPLFEIEPIGLRIFMPHWRSLDADNQAALVLHELFYREALTRSFKTSQEVRTLNGILGSNEFDDLSIKDWEDILVTHRFLPMFPEYGTKPSAEALSFEHDLTFQSSFYVLHPTFSNNLEGPIDFPLGQSFSVKNTGLNFIQGYRPTEFQFLNSENLDLSYLSDFPLKGSVDPACKIRTSSRFVGPWGQRYSDIEQVGVQWSENQWGMSCESFLTDYGNDSVRWSGPIKMGIYREGSSEFKGGVPIFKNSLILQPPSQFGSLKVRVPRSELYSQVFNAAVDLETNEIRAYNFMPHPLSNGTSFKKYFRSASLSKEHCQNLGSLLRNIMASMSIHFEGVQCDNTHKEPEEDWRITTIFKSHVPVPAGESIFSFDCMDAQLGFPLIKSVLYLAGAKDIEVMPTKEGTGFEWCQIGSEKPESLRLRYPRAIKVRWSSYEDKK